MNLREKYSRKNRTSREITTVARVPDKSKLRSTQTITTKWERKESASCMNFANSCAVLRSTDPGQVRICLHACLAQSEPVRQAVMCWSKTGLFSSQHDPLTILGIYVVHSDHDRHYPPFFPIPISSLLPTTPFPSLTSFWFCFVLFL